MKAVIIILCLTIVCISYAQQINYTFNGGNGSLGLNDYGIVTSANSGQALIGAEGIGDIYANLNLGTNISGTRRFWHISKRTASDNHNLQFYFYDGSSFQMPKVTFLSNGNVGIGTASAIARLSVYKQGAGTDVIIGNPDTGIGGYTSLSMGTSADANGYSYITSIKSAGSAFGDLVLNKYGGNVGIGTTTPNQKLTVNGTIYGKEVKVDLSVPGPDYVFEKEYALPSLESIQTYINQNKHLPEVPSAKEMETNGINLSEMNMLLLKKVEELTLYILDQKKDLVDQKNDIQELKKEIQKIRKDK